MTVFLQFQFLDPDEIRVGTVDLYPREQFLMAERKRKAVICSGLDNPRDFRRRRSFGHERDRGRALVGGHRPQIAQRSSVQSSQLTISSRITMTPEFDTSPIVPEFRLNKCFSTPLEARKPANSFLRWVLFDISKMSITL
jgi:hypothetical protein